MGGAVGKNGLTLKQARFLALYTNPDSNCFGNASKAALEAGYTFRQSGDENLSKPVVQKAYQMLLDQMGLSDAYINTKVRKLCEAQKVQACDIYIKKENGKTVIDENKNAFIEVDDNQAQLGALKLACQLKERLNGKNGNGNPATTQNNQFIMLVNMDNLSQEGGGLAEYIRSFSSRLSEANRN